MSVTPQKQTGFTIVELLIVIVVIAILAAISIVAYTGVQARARDSQRQQDIKTIAKALEMYYIDHGSFPVSSCGSSCPDPKKINSSWATTSDESWSVLETALVPEYIQSLPKDPQWSLSTNAAIYGGYNYDYISIWVGSSCTLPGTRQGYLLTYRLESSTQQKSESGTCANEGGITADYSPSSEYIVIKN